MKSIFRPMKKLTPECQEALDGVAWASPDLELQNVHSLFEASEGYKHHIQELEEQIAQYGPDTTVADLCDMARDE